VSESIRHYYSIMGRVARYKKIKAFDPCAKRKAGAPDPLYEVRRGKRRKHNAKPIAFDLPPQPDNFPTFPKSKAVKASIETVAVQKSGLSSSLGFQVLDLKEEARMARMMREDGRSIANKKKAAPDKKSNVTNANTHGNTNKPSNVLERLDGESMRAFERRVKQETAHILRREIRPLGTKKKEKRKEFLKMKKAQKKNKGSTGSRAMSGGGTNYASSDEEVGYTNDEVVFGEQAERPPEFKQLPRGAKEKSSIKKNGSLLDNDKQITEQRNLEMLRRKVQAQYEKVKTKRKKAGDFHL